MDVSSRSLPHITDTKLVSLVKCRCAPMVCLRIGNALQLVLPFCMQLSVSIINIYLKNAWKILLHFLSCYIMFRKWLRFRHRRRLLLAGLQHRTRSEYTSPVPAASRLDHSAYVPPSSVRLCGSMHAMLWQIRGFLRASHINPLFTLIFARFFLAHSPVCKK